MEVKVVNLEEIKADLKIEYPCNWSYKVILNKNDDINKIIKDLNISDCKVKESNHTPNYKSYELSLEVPNEAYRLELFSMLKKRSKFVL